MRIPDLDLDLLRCFVQVAERGGFTPGALALGLTQSAVSLKVKRLEDLVGRRVFERTSRSVALTRDGETLLAYARRMLALNDEAVRRLVSPPVTGRLRLGVADHFVPRNLAPILARFARDFPDVRLEVEVGRSHELRAAQERGALDLVLGKRRDGETTGSILWTEPIVWVAAPGWVAPEGRPCRSPCCPRAACSATAPWPPWRGRAWASRWSIPPPACWAWRRRRRRDSRPPSWAVPACRPGCGRRTGCRRWGWPRWPSSAMPPGGHSLLRRWWR
ncbi:LysR family transcriptional regulator [Pseudoroseomonas wenyumeiae]